MTAEDQSAPVKSKAYLVDPQTLDIVWMNESAAESAPGVAPGPGAGIETSMPMAGSLGIPAAVREVTASGSPRHLRADVISTAKGSMGLAVSLYRLPDGLVLVIAEHAWRSGRESPDEGSRRPRRRGR